ncbi:electron transport complex subunit RsxC [Endothiovibrio diazotrophicus]
MKLFPFKGGVHPEGHKALTSATPTATMPLPERLYVPMLQHIGAPAEPNVKIGTRVLKGQPIATPRGAISSFIHAPTSGTVLDVIDHPAPHPSGLPILSVVIEADGEEEWFEVPIAKDPFELEPEYVAERVGNAGIVGMGGATFPSAVKLGMAESRKIHTLLMNGGECEPYLTCDDRLMQEKPDEVLEGVRLMAHALQTEQVIIAIEDNKPTATAAMRKAAEPFPEVAVVNVPARYPMGSEKQLIQTVTGREVPAGKLAVELGILVHNVATAFAVHEALRYGHALVSRIVTLSGGAIAEPKNIHALVGTPFEELVKFAGGFVGTPKRVLMGGPMMGLDLPDLRAPVVKGSSGLLALTAAESRRHQAAPCIRCGQCVSACPVGLLPLELANRSRNHDLDGALGLGLRDCIACGSCAYVCPAHIPLVHYFNFAKGELVARDLDKRKRDEHKHLAEVRAARLVKEAERKKAEAARKKAERAAKKAAEEAAKKKADGEAA